MTNLRNQIQERIRRKVKRIRSLREDLNVSGGLSSEDVRKIKIEISNLEDDISREQSLSREIL